MRRPRQLSKSCAPRILARREADVDHWIAWCYGRELAAARAKDEEISAELSATPTWSERWWWLLGKLDEARKRLLKIESEVPG